MKRSSRRLMVRPMTADELNLTGSETERPQKREGTWVCVSACAIAPDAQRGRDPGYAF
jgi:hypothetical protein